MNWNRPAIAPNINAEGWSVHSQPTADLISARLDLAARELTTQTWTEWSGRVWRYLRVILRSEQAAEDLTQDVFLRFYTQVRSGQDVLHIRRWLFTVARNLALNELRAHRSSTITLDYIENRPELEPATDPTQEAQAINLQRQVQLQAAMNELTDFQRQCIQLRISGLVYREIAEVLGTSVDSVADGLERAIKKVRSRLA